MGPSDGGWDAKVGRAHFVSDDSKKNALRFRMGQGDFVLKMGQNGAKNVQFGALDIAYGLCSKNTTVKRKEIVNYEFKN